MQPRFGRSILAPGLVIAVLGAALDVVQWLRAAPLWVDEEMIALNFRDRSFADLAGTLWLGQSAPLGWLFAQRAVLLSLGNSELAVRLVPLLFGIGTLACAAWIGRRWMGTLGAGLLVLLVWIGQWLSHYRFEVKHYSADAFWALLLPALAAWALEPDGRLDASRRRWVIWWSVAAAGLWFSNGALLAAPGCAVVLGSVILRRYGIRSATHFLAGSVIWLASFAVVYQLSLQYTHGNRYLRSYWSEFMPPDAVGAEKILTWFIERLEPLASNPGGTSLAIWLWACALAGFALTRRRLLAGLFATVPLAAFVLAALRIVPLHDRLALWIVPSLYVGVVMLADRGLEQLRGSWGGRRWAGAAAGALLATTALAVSANIVLVGRENLDVSDAGNHNHASDDRSAVRWLMQRRRPGDALVTTRLGWPAIWWYGNIPLGQRAPHGRLPDGTGMYQVLDEARRCGNGIDAVFERHPRLLVHIGFPDTPEGFRTLLDRELERFGVVVDSAEFSELSRVAVVEPHPGKPRAGRSSGSCIDLRPMRRW